MAKSDINPESVAIAFACLFFISLFSDKQITNADIKSQDEVLFLGYEEKTNTGKNRHTWLEFKFVGISSKFTIDRKDYKQFKQEAFKEEIQPYDTLIIKSIDNNIYQLSKKDGKEYTNFKGANIDRKEEFIWIAVMSLIGFLYCIINVYSIRIRPNPLFLIIGLIILIVTHLILSTVFSCIFSN